MAYILSLSVMCRIAIFVGVVYFIFAIVLYLRNEVFNHCRMGVSTNYYRDEDFNRRVRMFACIVYFLASIVGWAWHPFWLAIENVRERYAKP